MPPCVWGECDFHVNWLHASRIRPTHWRLNDDFDINQRRRRLTQNIHIGLYMCVCVQGMKWQKTGPTLRGSRGVLTVPVSTSFNRGGSSYRGRGDRRHSGPSDYHHHHHLTNGNHSGSYGGGGGGGGGYRGRVKPVSSHGPTRWTGDHLNGHSRGAGFSRGGRFDNGRVRSFETRSRGLSGDDFTHKYYGNCEVRPPRGATGQPKPRGFYHNSSASHFH